MSKPETRREVFVYAQWQGMTDPVLMGILRSELLRGKEVFSFEYNDVWLQSAYGQTLDPDLGLYSGMHYLNENKPNFGLFMDSSPDRWGRVLMRRREAALARRDGRSVQPLFETDYLLGVFDAHRMGALRFKLDPDGPFLNDNRDLATPPWTSIRELEEISLRLEEDDVVNDPEYLNWLNILLAPGSSLGGARPKASILDPTGQLWIAKFPSKRDDTDVGCWEMLTSDLARAAGIKMAECQIKKFSDRHHTFLTRRFDRSPSRERIHFASAMTLTGYTDGQEGASYLDLADFIIKHGENINRDLEELWRRIVFNILVSNTDDHLRNHGFILTSQGWALSPAYDINPVETANGLSLNISDSDNSLEMEVALSVSMFFRVPGDRAKAIVSEVASAVRNWRVIASKYGIPKAEQELKSKAFSRAL